MEDHQIVELYFQRNAQLQRLCVEYFDHQVRRFEISPHLVGSENVFFTRYFEKFLFFSKNVNNPGKSSGNCAL